MVGLHNIGHICDEACGIYYDPLCPCWYADGRPKEVPFDPETFGRLIATMRSPSYRTIFRAALTQLLKPIIEELVSKSIESNEALRRRDALSLKAHLASSGITVEAKGGKLTASPADKITAEVKRALAAYREILIAS